LGSQLTLNIALVPILARPSSCRRNHER